MRTIKGWSREEQQELEWHKENGNSVDDVIDTIYDPTSTCYLHDKYDYNGQNPEQIIFDIVDFWRGDARFPEKKYTVKLPDGNVLIYNDFDGFGWRYDLPSGKMSTRAVVCTIMSMDKIKHYDENLVPFAVEVSDD